VTVKRNLTIQLDADVIREAKVIAARRGTSVSGLVATELEHLVRADARYERARQRAHDLMHDAESRGGRTWRRDELHEG